jgi:hypothetical protein
MLLGWASRTLVSSSGTWARLWWTAAAQEPGPAGLSPTARNPLGWPRPRLRNPGGAGGRAQKLPPPSTCRRPQPQVLTTPPDGRRRAGRAAQRHVETVSWKACLL